MMKNQLTPEIIKDRNKQKILSQTCLDKATGCWLWQGQISNTGYGRVMLKMTDGSNKMHSVHRAAYRLFVGEIPKGKIVTHTCGKRLCINPEHFELVSEISDANWKPSIYGKTA